MDYDPNPSHSAQVEGYQLENSLIRKLHNFRLKIVACVHSVDRQKYGLKHSEHCRIYHQMQPLLELVLDVVQNREES